MAESNILEAKSNLTAEKISATREWIENHANIAEEPDLDELESLTESSIVESSDGDNETYTETETTTDDEAVTTTTQALGTQIVVNDIAGIEEQIKQLFNSINSIQTVGNVNIANSTGVHIGNVTNINGNIQIIHAPRDQLKERQRSRKKSGYKSSSSSSENAANQKFKLIDDDEEEEHVRRDVFIAQQRFKIPKELSFIVPRHSWLAQSPMEEYEYLQEPVKLVIICHTATESSVKKAINIRLIRDIQCFHIESREWNDIAYNFLVGCDGNAYEGRGWGVVGAHTKGYNRYTLGIAFVGCFMRELPSSAAINACKNLLKKAVEEGHLAKDYKLVCHCQCIASESPGRRLYEEIQKWDHFYRIEDEAE